MVNIWPNSTFEASTEPWQANAGSDTPVLSSEHAHGGARSMHAVRGAGTTAVYARADLDANGLTTAGTYRVTAWLWIPSTVGTGSHGLRVTGGGVATVGVYTAVRDEWVEVTGEFIWDGVGSAALDIFGSTSTAEMWVDDLTIDDGTEPPEPVPGSGIGCTVYTRDTTGNRIRLADGSPGDDDLGPVVLDDLKITWGRETTVDQPSAATCSLKMVDYSRGGNFADLIKVGTPLEVWAQPAGVEILNRNRIINPGNYLNAGGWEPGSRDSYKGGPNRFRDSWPTRNGTSDGCFGVWVAADPGTTGDAYVTTSADARFDVTPGETLAIQVHVKPGSTPRRAALKLEAYDAAGATVSTITLPAVTEGSDWTQIGGIVTVPDNTAKGGLVVQFFDVAASTGDQPETDEYHYVDAGMVCPPGPDGTVPDYFDGDTVDPTGTYAYTWAGVPHKSESIQSTGGDPSQIVPVFSGRCTSITQKWDDSFDQEGGDGAPVAEIAAIDFTADLENVVVGDEPWPVQRWSDRFRTIAALAGLTQYELDLFGNIDVSYRDVDAQGAMGLLGEIASSLDGILWPTTASAAPALWLEDPTERPSLSVLAYNDASGYVEIVPASPGTAGEVLTISACDVLRDDVEWVQDVQDVTTRVSVTWKEQTLDEDGKPAPTDRTRTVVHSGREQDFGRRAVSLSSQLITDLDATNVAERILARTAGTSWRVTGITIADDAEPAIDPAQFDQILISLLGASTRHGLAIHLADLPAWAPTDAAGVYLEGGEYTFAGGAWLLDLTVSNPAALGQSVRWAEIREHPTARTWTWEQFAPAISWADLYGVAKPADPNDTLEEFTP